MDRLLLTLSNDGRVAYATADGDAFHVGPIQGGAAARVEADSINDLAFCGDLLLVCTKDGLVRIRRRDAWAYTLKVSEEAGACTVAPGMTQEAWYRSGSLLTRLKFDGAPTASHFTFSRPPTALAPVDAETLIGVGSSPTVAELVEGVAAAQQRLVPGDGVAVAPAGAEVQAPARALRRSGFHACAGRTTDETIWYASEGASNTPLDAQREWVGY